jgi:hypothetical protein
LHRMQQCRTNSAIRRYTTGTQRFAVPPNPLPSYLDSPSFPS